MDNQRWGTLDKLWLWRPKKKRVLPLFLIYSAWYGGAWERTIRTVKTCLYKTIARGKVYYFELLTILSDVERDINNNPLNYRRLGVECIIIQFSPECQCRLGANNSDDLEVSDQLITNHPGPYFMDFLKKF